MSRLTDFLKNSFYLLMFLLVAPQIILVLTKQYTTLITPTTKVAVLPITQMLMHSNHYVKNLKKFFKDPSIKAILLRIDCPGGAAGTSQAIYNELTYLKQQYPHKPVIVFVENLCASGAYYIAAPCDWIVASGSALIGSIGVYIALPRLKEFINQYKIEYSVTKTGKYKALLNPLVDAAQDEQNLLQQFCDDTYQQFTEDVAKARPVLSLKDADSWANGRIFTGRQALKLSLIDQIGSLSHVEQQLRERAHIPSNQEIQWIQAEQKNMLMKLLSSDDGSESHDELSLSVLLHGLFTTWINRQPVAYT